jgi:signal transduction histidine kinase
LASGRLDQQIPIHSNDELGSLGQAFKKMSANVRDTMAAISDEKSKLTSILSNIADGVIMTDFPGEIFIS